MSVQPDAPAYGAPPAAGPRLTPEQRRAAAEQAEVSAAEQALLIAALVASYAELWEAVDPALRPDEFVALLAALVDDFADAARFAGAVAVNGQRRIAGLPPLPDLPDSARVLYDSRRGVTPGELVARDALYDVIRRVDRRLPEPNRNSAFAAGLGKTIQRSLEPGRAVVTDLADQRWRADAGDPTEAPDGQILGWYRLTDGDPCAFCAMLASRGAVYSSAASAGVRPGLAAAGEGSYPADTWHPSCGCSAAPLYSTDADVPELNIELRRLWDEATAGLSGANARNAYRRAIGARRATEAEVGAAVP